MVFSSLTFFLVFLTLNLICYSFAKDIRSKNIVMLVFSLVFYTWGRTEICPAAACNGGRKLADVTAYREAP